VLGDNPDWDKWQKADALEEPTNGPATAEDGDLPLFNSDLDEQGALELEQDDVSNLGEKGAMEESGEDPDEDPEVNVDYPSISQLAREFACDVFNLQDPPCNAELLFLSAGKVGANLAGGHGLGYDDEFICGNIVKCRWALSDCEFCREMLDQLHEQTGEPTYATLAEDSRRIADAIRERIAQLRRRVWW
jgi:hypothetical protein